jgi:hypothetical protein
MQYNDEHVKDCRLLGIAANLNLREMERAWRDLKTLYAEDSLATYGLLEGQARQEKLEELEAAFDRIVHRLSHSAAERPAPPAESREKSSLPFSQLSSVESIGSFLRDLRESSGLTLRDIANRTKVSPMRLDQIEQEMFERLPEAVYLRGFVLEYAKVLGFPQPHEVAGLYLARYKEGVAEA